MSPAAPDLLERIAEVPLFAGLEAGERAELAAALRLVRFAAGDALMTQGARADGAYFILSGRTRVATRLPGGGETPIAETGAGSVIGELALIGSGRRTATVRAVEAVHALFMDRRVFRAALTQLRPGALEVLRRLARVQSERLRLLHGKIREAAARDARAWSPLPLSRAPGTLKPEAMASDFDVDRFLPILPCFRHFDAADIAAMRAQSEILRLPRSTLLCAAGAAPEHCYVVVRGAVASGFVEAERLHQLNVLGPGRFCALGPLIEDRPLSVSYLVRENAVLLRLARRCFLELLLGDDQTALMLASAVNEHQAAMVLRASNHLTRLIGLSRLSRQFHGSAPVSL